eukprot:356114-Chlamydomonas_euryale.AAC.6
MPHTVHTCATATANRAGCCTRTELCSTAVARRRRAHLSPGRESQKIRRSNGCQAELKRWREAQRVRP